MASGQAFKEKTFDVRAEFISSRKSSFYTLSNRVIVPGLWISLLASIPISLFPLFLTLFFIVLEIVIKYIFRTTFANLFRSAWFKSFGSERKGIKN